MEKKEYIRRLAVFLCDNGMTMSVEELAMHLNRNDFRTSYGAEYQGARGTYTLVHSVYNWLTSKGEHKDAEKVANAFPKSDGSFAYD